MKKKIIVAGVTCLTLASLAGTACWFNTKNVFKTVASTDKTITFDKDSVQTGLSGKTNDGCMVFAITTGGNYVVLQLSNSGTTLSQAQANGYLAQKTAADNNFNLKLYTQVSGLKIQNVTVDEIVSVTVNYDVIKDHEGSNGWKDLSFYPDSTTSSTTYRSLVEDVQSNHAYKPSDGSYTNKASKYRTFVLNIYGNYIINVRSITVKYTCA